jgi:zinc protease
MRWTDSVIRDVLPNGLTLLVQRDTSVPVVAVVTHVRAGYFDEPDAWTGIAHVLEHMFFKGTPRHGPGVLARETQLLGGYLNASTSYDRTVYYAVVPSAGEGLARAMALQADALMHTALDPDELARELEVVIQEAKRKLDTPGAVAVETLYELLFRVHRMRRWRIGTEQGLRTLDAAAVRSYYESRYTPDRVIVALTGDLDPDTALRLARSLYGDWRRPAAAVEPSPAEPDAREARRRVLRGDVERPLAAIGWRTVGPLHPDAPALDVAAEVLGTGRAAWLATAVRLPGLASAVGAGHYTPHDVGVFDVSLTSDTARITEAMERAVALTRALAEPGPDAADLARVVALLDSWWARRLESADGRGMLLAEFEALGGYALADEYRTKLRGVAVSDVRRAAARWLTPNAACAVTYLPREADAGVDEWPWRPTRSDLAPPRPAALGAWRSGGAVSRAAVERVSDVLVRRQRGADVLVRQRRGTGLVALGVFVPGVTAAEGEATAGISRLLLRASLRGAAGRSADELAAAAELLGGGMATAADVDALALTLQVRAAAAREGLLLLRAVLEQPALADDDVRRERDLQADDAARWRDEMFGYPLERAWRAAFAGHPYGLPPMGEPDGLRALEPEDVRAWQRRVAAARPVVTLVGDLEPDELLAAGDVFADWPGATASASPPVATWVAGRHVEERDKTQTALAMAFPASARDRYGLAVLAALLSGLAGRLFDELRERRALAYTVHAAPWLRRAAGAMVTYIATSPDREQEARAAMLTELARVADGPLEEAEVERARRYAAGLVAIRRQHASAVAAELADAWLHGRLEAFTDEEARRRGVTADDLREVARAAFVAEARSECVVRGTGGGR